MREYLAIARSKSRMDVCATEAFADPIGVLLMRFLDNDQWADGGRAKRALSDWAAGKCNLPTLKRNDVTHRVLLFLKRDKCHDCHGRGQISSDTGVYKPCQGCDARGSRSRPPTWTKAHHRIADEALARIGRALAESRSG